MFEGLCGDVAEVFGDDGQGEIYSAVTEIDSVPNFRSQEAHAAGIGIEYSIGKPFPTSEQKIIQFLGCTYSNSWTCTAYFVLVL